MMTTHVVAKAVTVLHLAAQHDAARLEAAVRVVREPGRRLVGWALQLILRSRCDPSASQSVSSLATAGQPRLGHSSQRSGDSVPGPVN